MEWQTLKEEIESYPMERMNSALAEINAKHNLGLFTIVPMKMKIEYCKEVLDILKSGASSDGETHRQ